MTIPTSAQISYMRTVVAQTFTDTCVIQDVTQTSDGAGGWSETWAAVTGGTVSCRLDHFPLNNQATMLTAGAESLRSLRYLCLPFDAPARPNRRVVMNSGTTYEIVSLSDDGSNLILRKALVARID